MPFSPETLEFLAEVRRMNSREWYLAHKHDYIRCVLDPMRALVGELSPAMLEIDAFITEPKVDRTISRIYRDTRFSRDKSLYRDHAWLCFMVDKKIYEGPPAYFFEIAPDGFRYGVGFYKADSPTMRCLRDMAAAQTPEFVRACSAAEALPSFKMEGDMYVRSKYPGASERVRRWADRKNICLTHESTDFGLLFSDGLKGALISGFTALTPVYKFMRLANLRSKEEEWNKEKRY